jgi:hypothetical protein
MFDRRSKARLAFLGSALDVARRLRGWPRDDEGERRPLARGPFLGALLARIALCWARDNDAGRVRSSRVRRSLVGGVAAAAGVATTRLDDDDRHGALLGWSVGRAAYRLRYGVLGALPDEEE